MRPASEPIETMRPEPRSIMCSSTAWVALMKPHMSMAISRCHSWRGFSMKRRSTVQPAQLTSTSTPPSVSIARSMVALTSSASVTSVRRCVMPPSRPSAITASACASSTSAIMTLAPSWAKPSVRARPMFDAPPVITTPLPSRFRSTSAHHLRRDLLCQDLQALEPPAAEQREDQVVDAGLHQRPRALDAILDGARDGERADELVTDRALMAGARGEVLAVVVLLLGALDLLAERFEARGQLLDARLQAGLRARPRADVGQRGLAILLRRQGCDEADANV